MPPQFAILGDTVFVIKMSTRTKENLKGAISIGAIVTIGIFVISGLVATVTEMVQTKAIATEAKTTADFAATQTATIKDRVSNIDTNVQILCAGLKIKCIAPK